LSRSQKNDFKLAVCVIFNTTKKHARRRKAFFETKTHPHDNLIFMSKQRQENVSTTTTSLKMKRAPVWPFATMAKCEEVLTSLTTDGILQEFSPPTHGASTQRRQRAKSNMNVSSVPSTTKVNGQARRSANKPRTPHGPQSQLVLREFTSPPSIPVSPNYVDPLFEEEEEDQPLQPQDLQQ